MPGSTVNELRRDSLEKLLLLREKTPERMIHAVQLHDTRRTVPSHKLAARFESWEQVPRQAAEQLWRIVLPIAEAEKVPQPLREKTVLELPRVLFGNLEQQTAQRIQATRSLGFAGYEFSNIAGVRLCAGLPMFGGFGLNITNPIAAEEYKQLGLAQITLLPELTLEQMAAIDPGIPTAMIVYGHMPLMITRACPMQNVTDCKHCSKKGVLTDRKAAKFPVRCGLGVRTIYRSRRMCLPPISRWKPANRPPRSLHRSAPENLSTAISRGACITRAQTESIRQQDKVRNIHETTDPGLRQPPPQRVAGAGYT